MPVRLSESKHLIRQQNICWWSTHARQHNAEKCLLIAGTGKLIWSTLSRRLSLLQRGDSTRLGATTQIAPGVLGNTLGRLRHDFRKSPANAQTKWPVRTAGPGR